MTGRSGAVAASLLLVLFLALGSAFASQARDETAASNPVSNHALTKGFASVAEGVNSRVMWAGQGVVRRTLLATNDSIYEQQLIDAANAHAAAALAITPRPDPTNGMKKYEGGYNVKDSHYWASVAFTIVYGVVLAIISLLVGVLYLLFKCFCACCCSGRNKKPVEYTLTARLWPKALVLVYTLLAISGAVVVYTGNGKLSTSLRATTSTIVTAVADIKIDVDQVAAALTNATQALDDKSGSSAVMEAAKGLQDATTSVNLTVQDNKDKVYSYFDKVKLALTIVAAIVLALSVAGLASTVLGVRPLLLILFVVALIVLFLTWLLFGVTFMLDNVITDTCQAMEQYTIDSRNSSLGELLPCINPDTANDALNKGKQSVKNLVSQVNGGIKNANDARAAALIRYPTLNSGSAIPYLCDPYGPSPEYDSASCPSDQGRLGTFRQNYSAYACDTDDGQTCDQNHKPIKKTDFNKMVNATGAAESVIIIMPVLFDLVTCQFVNVTFTKVVTYDCAPMKTSLNLLWTGFVVVSVAFVFLEIFWMVVRTRVPRNDGSRVQHINDQPL